MKNTTSILTLLLINFFSINAQTNRQSDYRFAFVIKPQVSWLKTDHSNVESNGDMMGYNFGIEMDKFFAKNYAIYTGLTINTTGGKLRYKEANNFDIAGETVSYPANSTIDYHIKYIEIPLCIKLQTSDFQRTSYYGIFGLSTQYNIKANDDSGDNLKDEVRFFNLGYQFGGGLQYSVGGNTYLKFGLTYNQGITDITKNKNVDDKAILNRLIFCFGVIF